MNVNFKAGVKIITKRANGVWYNKGTTGTIKKFASRKSGKEFWIIEVNNSEFTVSEDEIDVFNEEELKKLNAADAGTRLVKKLR